MKQAMLPGMVVKQKAKRQASIYRDGSMPERIDKLYFGPKARQKPHKGNLVEVSNAKTGETGLYIIIAVDRFHYEYSVGEKVSRDEVPAAWYPDRTETLVP